MNTGRTHSTLQRGWCHLTGTFDFSPKSLPGSGKLWRFDLLEGGKKSVGSGGPRRETAPGMIIGTTKGVRQRESKQSGMHRCPKVSIFKD